MSAPIEPLTEDEEAELASLHRYIQNRITYGHSRWHGDRHKASGLVKMLYLNTFVKELLHEQDNQGLPETSGSGGTGDADKW